MSLVASESVQFLRLDQLRPWEENPRSITDERLRALRDALRHDPAHLLARPLQADETGAVFAGAMRLIAIAAEREKLAGGSPLVRWLDEHGGIPTIVSGVDRKTLIERNVRDNQAYGEWLLDDLSTLATDYAAEVGSMKLLGVDPEEEAALRAMVESAREEETPAPPRLAAVPEIEDRRRTTAYAVTIRFEEKADRDRFAAELREQGHEHVQAHVGRWE